METAPDLCLSASAASRTSPRRILPIPGQAIAATLITRGGHTGHGIDLPGYQAARCAGISLRQAGDPTSVVVVEGPWKLDGRIDVEVTRTLTHSAADPPSETGPGS